MSERVSLFSLVARGVARRDTRRGTKRARDSHERLEPLSSTSSKRENVHRAHAQASEHTIAPLVSCHVSSLHLVSSHVAPLVSSIMSLATLFSLDARHSFLLSPFSLFISSRTRRRTRTCTHVHMRDLMISLPRHLMISLPPSLLHDLITA